MLKLFQDWEYRLRDDVIMRLENRQFHNRSGGRIVKDAGNRDSPIPTLSTALHTSSLLTVLYHLI